MHAWAVWFAERLRSGRFPVALEITPPHGVRDQVLLRRAGLLGEAACAINVVSRPERQSSLDASLTLRAAGHRPAWHLVTRGSLRDHVQRDLTKAHAGGIDQVLVVRGDHEGGDSPNALTIREVVSMARDVVPGALLGATLNQYVPERAAVLRNLVPKLKAGAGYVQTQPVFDLGLLRPLAEAVKAVDSDVRVVAMVMPLLTPEAVARVSARLDIALPAGLADGVDTAWGRFDEMVARLVESPFVDGVAVMTFEMDPPAAVGARIAAGLRRAGC